MNYITKIEGIRYINKLLHEKIRDFSSYNKIIKDKFNICCNIPIYIDENIILLPLKRFNSYDCIWINYVNIKSYISLENKVMIKFKDDTIKTFEISIKETLMLSKYLSKRVYEILDYSGLKFIRRINIFPF